MTRRGFYITMIVTTILLCILALKDMGYQFLAAKNVQIVAMGATKK